MSCLQQLFRPGGAGPVGQTGAESIIFELKQPKAILTIYLNLSFHLRTTISERSYTSVDLPILYQRCMAQLAISLT